MLTQAREMTKFDVVLKAISDRYQAMFGPGERRYVDVFADLAVPVLATIDASDAPYHNVEHTLDAMMAAHFILQGKQKYEGRGAVSPSDWLQLLASVLHHDIGYVKGACAGDRPDLHRYVNGTGGYIDLPPTATGAALSKCHVDRSKAYVANSLSRNPYIDAKLVRQNIEMTRFPVPRDSWYQDSLSSGGLCRAADLLGQFSDPRYLSKLPDLFNEFEETGANKAFGYEKPEDLQASYPDFYADQVHPYVGSAINYLGVTRDGRKLISRLYTNILRS